MSVKKIGFFLIFYFFVFSLSSPSVSEAKTLKISHPNFKVSELNNLIITMKGNDIDISSLMSGIKKAAGPYHDMFHFINTDLKEQILEIYLNPFCQKAKDPDLCQRNTRHKFQSAINSLGEKLSKDILYPEDYKPLSSTGYFKSVMDLLEQPCAIQCTHPAVATVLINETDEKYSELYNKIKTKSRMCQKNILERVEKEIPQIRVPKKCLQEENKNRIVCKTMLQHINTVSARLSALTELAYGPKALNSSSSFCMECLFSKKSEDNTNHFTELIEGLEQKVQCTTLKPGQQKRVHAGTDPGLNSSYLLKKETDGSYSIAFNLHLSADEDYDGSVPKQEVPEHYLKKIRQCLQKANQKLLGPEGQKLSIIINKSENQKEQTCKESDTKNITIGSKDFRSSHQKYRSNIDCPTITHEILHLLGLCDTYKEKTLGYYIDPLNGEIISPPKKSISPQMSPGHFQPAYDCRVTKQNNIMSNHHERWDNVFKKNKNSSLLTAEQFKAILYGACEEKNKSFNECSRLAYQSSIKNPDCLKKKEKCKKENK